MNTLFFSQQSIKRCNPQYKYLGLYSGAMKFWLNVLLLFDRVIKIWNLEVFNSQTGVFKGFVLRHAGFGLHQGL